MFSILGEWASHPRDPCPNFAEAHKKNPNEWGLNCSIFVTLGGVNDVSLVFLSLNTFFKIPLTRSKPTRRPSQHPSGPVGPRVDLGDPTRTRPPVTGETGVAVVGTIGLPKRRVVLCVFVPLGLGPPPKPSQDQTGRTVHWTNTTSPLGRTGTSPKGGIR